MQGRKIRVVVANRPRLLRELVLATICDQPDIEVAGVAQDEGEIFRLVEQMRPDFLIVAMEESDRRPAVCDRLLDRHPRLRILAIAPDRSRSVFYWTSVHIRSQAMESSEEGLLRALRMEAVPVESES